MFIPDLYYKDVFSINYKLLKKMGIKVLLFDMDNTIRDINHTFKELKERKVREDVKELFKKLKKDFDIYIVSNNASPKKVMYYASYYDVGYITGAKKPFHCGFKKALKYGKKEELCAIGDQMLTDVLGAKTFGIKVVLVDRLGDKDSVFTLINRRIENLIMKRLKKKNLFEKGKYNE
jgi:HAD superfamily phosphatase (TIGR01668 family)